jgi:hypothetical protein
MIVKEPEAPTVDDGQGDAKVIPIGVKFHGSVETDAPTTKTLSENEYEAQREGRCLHRKTYVDDRARVVTCQDCDAVVDAIEVLLGIIEWIRQQEHRYGEMKRREREGAWAHEVQLYRVARGREVGELVMHHTRVNDGAGRLPVASLIAGDYVSRNWRYRVREYDEPPTARWRVSFYDAEHGLKELATASRATLAQARTSVREHWMWWNRNKPKGVA